MKVTVKEVVPVVVARAAPTAVIRVTTSAPAAAGPGVGPTPEQIQAAVDAYLMAHPPQDGKDATDDQVAAAVSEYLVAHPPRDGDNATPEQVAQAVAAYLAAHPPKDGEPGKDATAAQVAFAVEQYLAQHPPADGKDASDEQVAAVVAAYFAAHPPPTADAFAPAAPEDDAYLLRSLKGQPFGLADLDGSGGLAQRMKIAAGSTPGVIRDTQGEGNGKASVYPASIASDGAAAILIKTGIWQSGLDYAFRVFGTCKGGVVNLSIYRIVLSGDPYVAKWGYMNNGDVPVTVTFGSFADGYGGWAIEGDFGRGQFVVTDAAVVGNGTGDPQVRDWSMMTAANTALLNSQTPVPRQSLAAT
ncbi:hypothetical protein GCM10007242_41630 [Pigmentiphaga litoralis]|uniref:hypothetical protein n=1 Tax=Pigmentiphaga litoralis TaxID=516702 RepID=UPI0016725C98|nr:hypothetical protein [Pigmentiphaga litoralis]GGX30605.1 hypothetical protein GCM10007242_41630 [Pigmentiphaga litoralis]